MEQKGEGCMSNVYESIMTGLNEAVEDSKSYEKKINKKSGNSYSC